MDDARKLSRSSAPLPIFLLLALIFTACGGADGEKAADGGKKEGARGPSGVVRYTLPGEQVFPEGVAYQRKTGDFFVSSTTDGTVFRGTVDGGSRRAEVFLKPAQDGRTTAIGMETDGQGRLYVSGGDTGRMFVYDTDSGDLIQSFTTPEAKATFINDVGVTPRGDAYFTDSMRPILFRVSATGGTRAESWLNFKGTPLEYEEGFNLNGIDSTGDGRYLIVVQTNTGELFRIDTGSRKVVKIDLGGKTLTNGDGLVLDGSTVYIVRNQQGLIVPVRLSDDYASGDVGKAFTDPSLAYPTTAAKHGNRLLVVNSQFDKQGGEPDLPFTVSDVEIP
jgi:sugar lactone lactonase YvrE